MRKRWSVGLLMLAGCLPTMPEEPVTQQVASTPFSEPRRLAPVRVNYAPASQEASYRVLLIKDKLVGGQGSLSSDKPLKTVGSFWPYATTLFDYIHRAMPYQAPGSLEVDDTYAVAAYILSLKK